jgi:TolB-like protein
MDALIAAGDSGAALNHYRVHESLVREELSSAPDPSVGMIARRARELAAAAASAPSGAAPHQTSFDVKSIHDSKQSENTVPIATRLSQPPFDAPPAEPPRDARANRILKSRTVAMVATAIVGASVLVALAFIARSRAEPESARRVVIAPFENRTGDPRLDALGTMTADWITDGLSRTGLVSVIDPGTAFFAARDAHERTGSVSGSSTAVRAISLATDADIVATGDYFRRGDSLEFHARVSDARNERIIASMEPVMVAVESPTSAVEVVRQRVLGILARELDPRLSEVTETQSEPPTFDAYRAYTLGLQFFTHRDYRNAAVQFRSAYGIDTSFAAALIWTSVAYDYAEENPNVLRALLDTLLPKRGELTTLDAYALDAMRASYAGWLDSSITAAKAAAAIAPQSQWVFNAASWSIYANRPHEAIVLLERLDPMRGWLKGWSYYWIRLSDAKHMVGNYRGESEAIERGLRVAWSDDNLQLRRMRSLAVQGRYQELDQDVNALLASSDTSAANRIVLLLYELRAHGHYIQAERLFARALPYFASKWRTRPAAGFAFGELLFLSERWKEARRQFEFVARDASLMTDSSRLLHNTAAAVLGQIGSCAAALGDTTAAVAIADSLGRITGEKKPDAIYWEAIVLAKLRRRAEAVALLRQAYALGYPKAPFFGHSLRFRFPDLFGYAPFEEFFKPDS